MSKAGRPAPEFAVTDGFVTTIWRKTAGLGPRQEPGTHGTSEAAGEAAGEVYKLLRVLQRVPLNRIEA